MVVNQGVKKYWETTFTVVANLPYENACIGVFASTILTPSRVGTVLAVMAMAATPTFPTTILVLEIECSSSTIVIPKKQFVQIIYEYYLFR